MFMFCAEIILLMLLVVIEPFIEDNPATPAKALILLFMMIEPFEFTLICGVLKPWN